MARQLSLLDTPRRRWQLDAATRERGRRGVAEARASLAAALAATADASGREHPTHGRSAA